MKCNKCGKEFKDDRLNPRGYHNPMMHKFVITFGYGSIHDTEQMTFWLCEDCIFEDTKDFKILPKIEDYDI